jgi:hypothetical protein
MPFEIKLEKPVAGFAAQSALPGEPLLIEMAGFHTSSEGEPFIRMLEGLSQYVCPGVSIVPSSVDHFLIIAAPDGKMNVYVNELRICLKAQLQTTVQAVSPSCYLTSRTSSALTLAWISRATAAFAYSSRPVGVTACGRSAFVVKSIKSCILESMTCGVGF